MNTEPLEVEYVESGTFVGGEEDVFLHDIERGETCVVLKKEDFLRMIAALRRIAEFETEPIWSDSRDDAADDMVRIAAGALGWIEE